MTPAIKAAFDKQPVVRLAAAKAHLRGYVVNKPRHDYGLCHWLTSRGVDGQALIEAYRAASEGPDAAAKPLCQYEGPTWRRLEFASKLLADLEGHLKGGAA